MWKLYAWPRKIRCSRSNFKQSPRKRISHKRSLKARKWRTQSNSREEEPQQQLAAKEDINKMLRGSPKLTNILLLLCKLGLGRHNHEGEFNKLFNFVIVSIPLRDDFTHETRTLKNILPKERNLYMF